MYKSSLCSCIMDVYYPYPKSDATIRPVAQVIFDL